MDSILNTVKKLLGIETSYEAFDTDLIININMALNILNQLGVGPSSGFSISDATATWTDFIPDTSKLEMVKTYVYLKVKQVFDPNQNSNITQAYDNQIKELEWRLNVQVDPGDDDNG